MFRFILILGIASMLFLMNGCNDTPNSIGKGTQPPEDDGVLHIDTVYATTHSTVPNRIFTTSIDRFMLGKYKTYQAWACLKFYSWPDSMVGAKITSATIRLKSVYHFGDSLAPLSFNAYRAVSNLFLSDSLTYDSLNGNIVNSAHGVYYNTDPLPLQTIIPVGDTESVTIQILDTTMLREWFSTNTDTTNLNDGLVLRPTNTNSIRGFYSFTASDTSYLPTLYVTYEDTNGSPKSYSHKIGRSEYVSTVDQTSLISDTKFIYIQNGISYRGLLSFDSISTPWPVSIHRAVLQLTLNASQSSVQLAPFFHDSLYALSVGTNDKSDGMAFALSQQSIDSSGHPVYSFEAGGKGGIAARILSKASAQKVLLSGFSETGSFDLHTLYGTLSEKKLKPRLIITYSVQR